MAVLTAAEYQALIASDLGQVDARTTLAADLAAGALTLTVVSAAGFPAAPFRITIDAEVLLVTAVVGTTFTVSRAQQGTTDAAHSATAQVAHLAPLFEAQLLSVWSLYADEGLIRPRLQYLHAKHRAIQSLLSGVWEQVDISEEDASEKRSQKSAHLKALLEIVGDEIKVETARATGRRGIYVGPIERTAPVSVLDENPYPIEPSDRAYRGDPLRRTG